MSDFSFVPLRPFFRAALAKRWKVQFRKGLLKFNIVDSKTTYFNENCYIYIGIYIYIIHIIYIILYIFFYRIHFTFILTLLNCFTSCVQG